MALTWLNNNFICKEFYAPFTIEKDNDYCMDLDKRYSTVLKQALNAGADEESIKIIMKCKSNIISALKSYYKADLAKSNRIILNIIKDIGNDPLADNSLTNSFAFPGDRTKELQFFRCRPGNPAKAYKAKDMLHLPYNLRAKTGNYRFSIPGNPSFYLSNTSYGCWIEANFPAEIDFCVSPVILDGTQRIFNLVICSRDASHLNDFSDNRVHCWLKLLMLSIATSYVIKEEGRIFKSEYVISQAVMMACKKLGYDGVAYYSRRVSDEMFALCAINLALFVDYVGQYSNIINHIKIDDAFNYAMYKNLLPSLKYKCYELRSAHTNYITNVGNYDKQFPYRETDFYRFDQFLFTMWRDKPNGRGKDHISWGVEL